MLFRFPLQHSSPSDIPYVFYSFPYYLPHQDRDACPVSPGPQSMSGRQAVLTKYVWMNEYHPNSKSLEHIIFKENHLRGFSQPQHCGHSGQDHSLGGGLSFWAPWDAEQRPWSSPPTPCQEHPGGGNHRFPQTSPSVPWGQNCSQL